jgi:hypothetical protein
MITAIHIETLRSALYEKVMFGRMGCAVICEIISHIARTLSICSAISETV